MKTCRNARGLFKGGKGMINEYDNDLLACLISLLLMSAFLGAVCGYLTGEMAIEKKAAATECAHFHHKTGKFEWIKQ